MRVYGRVCVRVFSHAALPLTPCLAAVTTDNGETSLFYHDCNGAVGYTAGNSRVGAAVQVSTYVVLRLLARVCDVVGCLALSHDTHTGATSAEHSGILRDQSARAAGVCSGGVACCMLLE